MEKGRSRCGVSRAAAHRPGRSPHRQQVSNPWTEARHGSERILRRSAALAAVAAHSGGEERAGGAVRGNQRLAGFLTTKTQRTQRKPPAITVDLLCVLCVFVVEFA